MGHKDIARLLEKEVMEKDVLNRIKWDSRLRAEDFTICYLDRIKNGLVEVPCKEVGFEGDFLLVGENTIPVHRVRRFLYRGHVVWEKRRSNTP